MNWLDNKKNVQPKRLPRSMKMCRDLRTDKDFIFIENKSGTNVFLYFLNRRVNRLLIFFLFARRLLNSLVIINNRQIDGTFALR